MQSWPSTAVPDLPRAAQPALQVHDSSSGGRRDATPESATARLYVCGITPYDATHLGHAATYLAFDTLVRVWRDRGTR
jgi:L-cysteine:1D-myo-inositol 2-amino-2-deoxy-alpha-D-glucopyranoside ligase